MAASAPPPAYWAQGQGAPVQAVMMAQPAPGSVAYFPQGPTPIVMQMVPAQPPDYNYKPTDYLILSIVMAVLCAVFSPLTLTLLVPAILFARKSRQSAKMGHIKNARNQGLVAAYLNVAAVVVAFLVALLATGLAIGLYSPVYYLQECREEVENGYHRYGCDNYY